MSRDKDAKRCWNEVAPQLMAMRLLTEADGLALEGLCRAYSVAVRADRELKGGVTIKTMYGRQQHPAVSISRLAWTEVRKFAIEFGLTPAARTRVSAIPEAEAEDTARTFLFGGKVAGAIRPA